MGGDAYKVFVVEDSPLLTRFLLERLRASEITVVGHADNAEDAISGIAESRPDAVIIDLGLRIGTGFDILRALQKSNGGHHPVRMVLTNNPRPPLESMARRCGADYFFDKAKDINRMVEALEALRREANPRGDARD